MNIQVTFRDVMSSEALRDHVHKKAAKLDTFEDALMSCRVAVEAPHRHHQHGSPFRVRIEVAVPGADIVVSHESADHGQQDVYAAVDDAFKDAERQLKAHNEKIRTHRLASRRDVRGSLRKT